MRILHMLLQLAKGIFMGLVFPYSLASMFSYFWKTNDAKSMAIKKYTQKIIKMQIINVCKDLINLLKYQLMGLIYIIWKITSFF